MTAWNYRKLAFEFNVGSLLDGDDKEESDRVKSIIDEELRVVSFGLIDICR